MLKIERFFTTDTWIVDSIPWILRDTKIEGSDSKIIFEMKNVEAPDFWSDQAVQIVSSKYFKIINGVQETSVKQLIHRVVNTIVNWGVQNNYFDEDNAKIFYDELFYILTYQYACFNSPILFNFGVPNRPQQSAACFLMNIEDSIRSILDWYKIEGLIFSGGSGSGINISTLRPRGAPLSAGGISSGPMSFLKAADASAGVIKSGGTTRRAATLRRMDITHPDIEEFIVCKKHEEEKARVLEAAGYSGGIDGEATSTVAYQNMNHSVGLDNKFMMKIVNGEEEPVRLMKLIADCAWATGDPGVQFDDTINSWNTIPNSGRITTSNPCLVGDTLVYVADGRGNVSIKELAIEGKDVPVFCFDKSFNIVIRMMRHPRCTGIKVPVYKVCLNNNYSIRPTENHELLLINGITKKVKDLQIGDRLKTITELNYTRVDGSKDIYDGEVQYSKNAIMAKFDYIKFASDYSKVIPLSDTYFYDWPSNTKLVWKECITCHKEFSLPAICREVVYCDEACAKIHFDELPLNDPNKLLDANQAYGFKCTVTSIKHIGYEDVYNGTVDDYHNFFIGGFRQNVDGLESTYYLNNKQCGEYLSTDYSSCLLASLNLVKFYNNGQFNFEHFASVINIMVTALDICICESDYPHLRFKETAYKQRQIGLGYSSLGGLLMLQGIPYGSEDGRQQAAKITSFMTTTAYKQSAVLAKELGPFPDFQINHDEMLNVIAKHKDEAKKSINDSLCSQQWQQVYEAGSNYGYRNATVTLIAPTGTISFMMDCSTTGIEPEFAFSKYKSLVGGGHMILVNDLVSKALRNLKYGKNEIQLIEEHIKNTGTIEGSCLKNEHLPIFDCAIKSTNGTRCIKYQDHILMVAAVQPFLSMGISKTINLPNDITIDDVYNLYIDSWKLGLKSVALYRDGSKISQPLNIGKLLPQVTEVMNKIDITSLINQLSPQPKRRTLPIERPSITHKIDLAGLEAYITASSFEDGTFSEVFIHCSKEGSFISGLLDSLGVLISLGLQYGVPLNVMANKLTGTKFEPSGFTKNPAIPNATSIVDYIFRWLMSKQESIKNNSKSVELPTHSDVIAFPVKSDYTESKLSGDICIVCGSLMVQSGTCHSCQNCGSTSGGCG